MMRGQAPLRVVFLEQASDMGGVEVTTFETASRLNPQKFKPLVVCPESGDLAIKLTKARIPVEIIPRPRFYSVTARFRERLVPNPFASISTLVSMCRISNRLTRFIKTEADLVVTKGLLAHFYGGAASARAHIPCIWHVQEVANSTSFGGMYVRLLNTLTRRWARAVVVDAQAVGRQFAPDLHAAGRIHLIYNGVDTQRFSPNGRASKLASSLNGTDRPFTIGHVGRIIPLKGQHVLLEAFAQLSNTKANVQLVFAGSPMFDTDRYLCKLKQMVRTFNLSGRVHFLGFRSNVPELLHSIDIFVHPSVEADSPVSILEAMAAGKPIIASRVPGTVDLLSDGLEGYLVSPNDAGALAEKLNYLIEHPDERQRLARAARAAAEKRYDQKVFIQKFEQVLTEAMKT